MPLGDHATGGVFEGQMPGRGRPPADSVSLTPAAGGVKRILADAAHAQFFAPAEDPPRLTQRRRNTIEQIKGVVSAVSHCTWRYQQTRRGGAQISPFCLSLGAPADFFTAPNALSL